MEGCRYCRGSRYHPAHHRALPDAARRPGSRTPQSGPAAQVRRRRRPRHTGERRRTNLGAVEGLAEQSDGKQVLKVRVRAVPEDGKANAALIETLAKALTGTNQQLAVIKVMAKELAPLPFMLPTFQKAAEDELSLGAKATLDALQVLYEGQLVSYPRTDCEYLPAEQKSDAQRIANSLLTGADEFSAYAGFAARMIPKDRIYNSAKVAEHHGLVPTGKLPPADLAPKLRKAWALVAKRFLCSLMPDFEYEETEVSFVFQGRKFAAKGIIPQNLDQSWKSLIVEKDAATPSLPPLEDGQISRVDKVNTKAGKTTPPKAYTEATLIADMRSVAKYVDDPRYKAILKETSGIGTAATQAATLETLKDRGFISPSGKKLVSTPFGRDLIGCLPPMLYDPGVTGLWEDALGKIAKNEYPPEEFMRRINIYVAQRINEMKTASKKMTVKSPIKKKELKSTRSVNPRQPPSEHEKANFA